MSAEAERLAIERIRDRLHGVRYAGEPVTDLATIDAALAARDAELALMAARADAADRARQDMLDQRRFLGIEPAEGPIVSMSEAQFAQRDAELARLRARIEALEGYVTAAYIDREEGYKDAARQLTERDAELARLREAMAALYSVWDQPMTDTSAEQFAIMFDGYRALLAPPAPTDRDARHPPTPTTKGTP